jgi:hypothetical protein
MSEWALKVGSIVTTLFVLVGSYGYAVTHVKNVNAPLQPVVADKPTAQPTPSAAAPTPIPSLIGTRRGNPPRATSSPAPRLTLQPGVQATDLPEVTFTHVS